jgi:hypothetical protein
MTTKSLNHASYLICNRKPHPYAKLEQRKNIFIDEHDNLTQKPQISGKEEQKILTLKKCKNFTSLI